MRGSWYIKKKEIEEMERRERGWERKVSEKEN